MFEFNINNYVYVQLNNTGREELEKQHNELNEFSNGFLGEFKPPKEDENGWSKWQLWHLMSKLGGKCGACRSPFYTAFRFEDKDMNPVI